MIRFLYLSLIVLVMISCAGKKKSPGGTYDAKAIELNNKAVKLMREYKNDSALILFDEAIETDESYYMPHTNKASIYIGQREYKRGLNEFELALEKKPDLAEGWTMAGMLSEKLGDSVKAVKYYQKSVEMFNKRIADPTQKDKLVPNRLSRALALILMGNEKEGRDELNKLKAEKPNDFIIDEFSKINKKDFIDKFFF